MCQLKPLQCGWTILASREENVKEYFELFLTISSEFYDSPGNIPGLRHNTGPILYFVVDRMLNPLRVMHSIWLLKKFLFFCKKGIDKWVPLYYNASCAWTISSAG